jgi:hypothetical protein
LTFDCETTKDTTHRLRFGAFQVRQGDELYRHGLFFNPEALNDADLLVLETVALEQPPESLSCPLRPEIATYKSRNGGLLLNRAHDPLGLLQQCVTVVALRAHGRPMDFTHQNLVKLSWPADALYSPIEELRHVLDRGFGIVSVQIQERRPEEVRLDSQAIELCSQRSLQVVGYVGIGSN